MMGVIFYEGFGQCATGDQVRGVHKGLALNWNYYTEGASNEIAIAALEDGDMGVKKSIEFPDTGHDYRLMGSLGGDYSTLTIGVRVYRYDANVCGIFQISAGPTAVGFIGIHSDGTLRYTKDAAGLLNDGTESWGTTGTVTQSIWTYCEVKIVLSNTVGEVYFYLDGTLDSSQTGIDTVGPAGTEYANGIEMSYSATSSGSVGNWLFTDIYVSDGDVLGKVECYYQPADTAGSAANFTPLSGSNHENVDETTDPDGDTTYNYSTSTGTKDQIAHDVTHTFGPTAIQPVAWAKAVDDEGAAKVKLGVLSDTTEDLGTAQYVGSEYTPLKGDIYETDPATSSAWTASGADDAETVIQHAT